MIAWLESVHVNNIMTQIEMLALIKFECYIIILLYEGVLVHKHVG